MDVGVVFGGRSVEHDVSIVTAHQIMAVLEQSHNVVPVYVTTDGAWLSAPGLNDLSVYREGRFAEVGEPVVLGPVPGAGLQAPGSRLRGPRRIALDVMVCAIHGTFGEDGTLQGLLELADIPYTGSGVLASAMGLDKVAMKTALRAAGLPLVPDVAVSSRALRDRRDAALGEIEAKIGYPVFVKPVRAGSSVGIAKATDRASLEEALEVAVRYDNRVLVERSMEGCIEVNCSVLGGADREPRVSVCEQPVPWQEFLSFEDKYMRGGKSGADKGGMAAQERRIPAPVSDEVTKQVQENALAAFRAVGASGVARVDSFVDTASGETWVMEINTMPGSFAFYLWEATGVSFAELAQTLLDIAVEEHARRAELMFTFDSGLLQQQRGMKTGG